MMKKTLTWIALLLLTTPLAAQHLAAFSSYRDYFYVFDAGQFKQLEILKVQSFQVGGVCVAYIDNAGAFKAYYNGVVYPLDQGSAIKYTATDYLLGWSIYDFLKVFENGKVRVLSTACDAYVIQDSLIAFYDRLEQRIKVYYKGDILTIEDGLITFPIDNFQSGDNIVAYVTTVTNKFKVFYRGATTVLDDFGEGMEYKAGRDIVAYFDAPRSTFTVFYKGGSYDLEYYEPQSFKMGDDMVAYVDNTGNFKLFKDGNVTTILTYTPAVYDIDDDVIVFNDQGYFKTYCNGSIQIIERYMPQKYQIDWHTIAYVDENQNIKAVKDCQKFTVTYEPVDSFDLIKDLIIYNVGFNITKVFYYGHTFVWQVSR